MKIKAVINPVSGRDSMRGVTSDLADRLKTRYRLTARDFYYTTPAGDDLAKSFLEDCDTLVVAGGDGTLHNVINAEKRFGLNKPIAYLPCGTTNDFGHCLSLPGDAESFCQMLEDHDTRPIDLGRAGNRYFHYVLSGGAVTTVSYTTQQQWKNKLGKTAYLLSSIPQIGGILKGTRIQIEYDHIYQEMEALALFVSNSPIVAGYKSFIPEARIDDGLLHVLILKKTDPLGAVGLYKDILKGAHINRPDVLYFTTKSAYIALDDAPTPIVGIDGEQCGDTSMRVEVLPGAQSIFVPKKQREAA